MVDGLGFTPFDGISVVGFAAFVSFTIIKGLLVPRSTHQDVLNDRDKWRELATRLQNQNTRLLIMGELGLNSIRAIEEKAIAQEGGESL